MEKELRKYVESLIGRDRTTSLSKALDRGQLQKNGSFAMTKFHKLNPFY